MADIVFKIGTMEFGRSSLQSVKSVKQTTTNPSSIQYGVIAKTGEVTLFDIDNKLKGIFNTDFDLSNFKAEIIVNGKKIGSYIVEDSKYSVENNEIVLQLSDDLSKWDRIYIGRDLSESTDVYTLISEILQTFDDYNVYTIDKVILGRNCVYGEGDVKLGSVADYLKTIKVSYPFIKSDTYRNIFDKLCTLAQLQCFQNDEGYPVFVSARPIYHPLEETQSICIEPYCMVEKLSYDLIKKNKDPQVEIQENVLVQETIEIGDEPISSTSQECAFSTGTIAKDKISNWQSTDKWYIKTFTKKVKDKNGYLSVSLNGEPFVSVKGYSASDSGQEEEFTLMGDELLGYESLDSFITHISLYETGQKYFDAGFLTEKDTTDYEIFNKETTYFIAVAKYGISQTYQDFKFFEFLFGGGLDIVKMPTASTLKTASGEGITITIGENEILTNKTFVGNIPLTTNMLSSIKKDYKNGISGGETTLFFTDLNYTSGDIAKKWGKGEILELNDIVFFKNDYYPDGSRRYWRVVETEFVSDNDLIHGIKLMEIKNCYDHNKWGGYTWYEDDPSTLFPRITFYGNEVFYVNKYITGITKQTAIVHLKDYNYNNLWYYLGDNGKWKEFDMSNGFIIVSRFSGIYVWNTKNNTYYSHYKSDWGGTENSQYKLKVVDGSYSWEEVSWTGLENPNKPYIWTDGQNIYHSKGTSHYKLNEDSLTWVSKTWEGIDSSFDGDNVWTFNDRVFCSQGDNHFELNKTTGSWEAITFGGLSSFYGRDIWRDKSLCHIKTTKQFTLFETNGELNWIETEHLHLDSFDPTNVWIDRRTNKTYYSGDEDQYVLTQNT